MRKLRDMNVVAEVERRGKGKYWAVYENEIELT